MNAENKVPRRRLPFWRTVIDAYVVTYDNLGYLARISWAWLLLMIPIAFAFHTLMFWLGWHLKPTSTLGWVIKATGNLLPLTMLASIAVAWHRKLLEGELWPSSVYLRLDRVVANYLGLVLVTMLLMYIPLIGVAPIKDRVAPQTFIVLMLGASIMMGAGIFVATRIWLALPAQALDRADATIGNAWTITRGSFWRLLWGSALCFFPIIAVVTFVIWMILGVDGLKGTTLAQYTLILTETFFGTLGTLVSAMPTVSFLSLAYRWLVMDGTDAPRGADQVPPPATNRI